MVDSKKETISINVDNIDQIIETGNEGEERLAITYHIPATESLFNKNPQGMERRTDEFDCAENEMILKAFKGIRNKMVGTGGIAHEKLISESSSSSLIMPPQKTAKAVAQTPTVQRRS